MASQRSDLLSSIHKRDIDSAKSILGKSHSDDPEKDDEEILMYIALAIELDLPEFLSLVQLGKRPELRKIRGITFINYAIANDSNKTFEYLLMIGQSLVERDDDDWTPLLTAAVYGKTWAVNTLLEIETIKETVNDMDRNRYTPLMLAASEGNRDIVMSLLNAGADPNMQDSLGATALELAIESYQTSMTSDSMEKYGPVIEILSMLTNPELYQPPAAIISADIISEIEDIHLGDTQDKEIVVDVD